jgi:hypothetical protein
MACYDFGGFLHFPAVSLSPSGGMRTHSGVVPEYGPLLLLLVFCVFTLKKRRFTLHRNSIPYRPPLPARFGSGLPGPRFYTVGMKDMVGEASCLHLLWVVI